MNFKIKKAGLNNLFFKIFESQQKEYKKVTLNFGGAGSGKSIAQAQYLVVRSVLEKIAVLCIRETESSHTMSTMITIKTALEKADIDFICHDTNKVITITQTGSQFFFKGCDKIDKLKSFAFPNGTKELHCWVEEADQIDLYDSQQLFLRLRGLKFENKIFFYYTFNPTSKLHWLYKEFFERERDDCYFFHSTYKDNKFIDAGYVKMIESYRDYAPQLWQIYGLGEFGLLQSGMECYHKFNYEENEKLQQDYFYDDEKTIYLSFDENVNPFCTLLVAQKIDDKIIVIDEFCLKGKDLEQTCLEFKKKYFEHKGQIFILGDPSSRKQDAKLERGVNFYTIVADYLSEFNPQIRTEAKAQNVYMRILFGNKMFHEKRIIIKSNCKLTIDDLQQVKWNSDGDEKNKAIEVTTNSDGTKMRAQKQGHQTDSLEYLYCLIFKIEISAFRNKSSVSKVVIDKRESSDY